jgi:hypothetical protein
MPSPDETPRVGRLATSLVGALGAAAFLPSLRNGFVYDDVRYVVKNPLLASWDWNNSRHPAGTLPATTTRCTS